MKDGQKANKVCHNPFLHLNTFRYNLKEEKKVPYNTAKMRKSVLYNNRDSIHIYKSFTAY